ncbi:MAG: ammonium transporter, partial [Pseudomonadota bacterium]
MKTRLALLAVLALLPALAFAADAKPTLNSGDTAWMLTSTALVLFMTLPGLALFYAGLVRSKNVLSVLMQCFAITAMISIVWALVGYSIAFGDGGAQNAWWGGLGKAFLDGVGAGTIKDTIPESVFVMFQMTFAIITPALVVGGFAERMKFSAMMWFSLLWVLLVYLPVCHWVWAPGGWLQKMNLMDFAGGTVVHINAGVAALVAALVLGRRKGFPQTAMPPHNLTMTVAGASMLWVGWFGFNAGSAVAANTSAGMAMLVTHLGAAAGAFAWMACEWVWFKKPSVLGIVTGMVAGLGTITPASGFVGPLGALVIGFTAGVVCFGVTNYMKRVLHIDDSLDVFPVHGIGGILGTFSVAIFAGTLGGLGYAEGMTMGKQIGVLLLGIGVT